MKWFFLAVVFTFACACATPVALGWSVQERSGSCVQSSFILNGKEMVARTCPAILVYKDTASVDTANSSKSKKEKQ